MAEKIHTIKYAPPPSELPIYQQVDPEAVSFFGKTNYEAALETKKFIFGIKREDRCRHIYVVGKNGVGKSKLLELLIRQDIVSGFGLCFIDAYGDVINDILDFVPEERIKDVVIVDPADTGYPVSFNPLQNVNPELKHQFTQGLVEIMEKQFGVNWTPRLEHVFRFTVLALLDYPEATMQGMIKMLGNEDYRQKVVECVEDDMIRDFWEKEFAEWSEKFNTEAIIPLVNKLGQFLSNPFLRNIFRQKENKIDFEDMINNQKILLVNLSKGQLGEENAGFFGSLFITKIKQAAMARASLPEEEKEDFYLYVDEFHNLATSTFESLFSGARKFGIAMTVSNQYMDQLSSQVQAMVLGNIATLIVFRVGGDDAVRLEKEMTPVFRAKDMINLGIQQFYIKMTIDGETFDPFSAETLKVLPSQRPSCRRDMIEYNRQNYAIFLK